MDHRKPKSCIGCPLTEIGVGFLHSDGNGTNGVLIVGEAAGKHEAKDSLPFRPHAAAGGLLERLLKMSGFKREEFTVYNIVNCQPPSNELVGAEYEVGAIAHCKQYVDAVVERVKPRMILALGNTAFKTLTGRQDVSVTTHRGYVFKSVYGVSVIGSYHPAFLLRGAQHLLGISLHDLRRAVAFARNGIPAPPPTNYCLNPTVDDCYGFLQRLNADSSLLLSIDIETASIIGEDEPASWKEKRMVQIQFSCAAGEALVVPFTEPFTEAIRAILLTENSKIGWHSRLSDEIALKTNGFKVGGEFFDGMTMLSHLQPNFAGGKDANDDEDKGVPAMLLNLQSAISFYFPWETPYKSLMRRGLEKGNQLTADQLWEEVRVGGGRDVDLTWRIGTKLIHTLKSQGLWDGYYRYKHQLGKVLTKMSERGLPIDRDRQQQLRVHIEAQELDLEAELQTMIPAELKPFKAYKGFPKDLREAVKAAGLWVKCCKPIEFPEVVATMGYEIVPYETETDEGEAYVEQQLRKPLPFNAGSWQQILKYINYRLKEEREVLWQTPKECCWFVPLHIDTGRPSTNKAGMEALIDATDDPALKHIEKCKKIAKLKDYCGEKWEPEADGCVHAEFRVGATGTGQTTATNPPIQTYPKHLKKEDEWLKPTMSMIKGIIKAPDGYVMIETDMVGFHAHMQGFLAEDAAYYRLSSIDTHSFLTAHYVGVEDKDKLLQLSDDDLLKRLKEIKKQYDYERNYLCKRVSFLSQFGGGAEKAATILRLPRIEVEAILDINRNIFKKAFKELPDKLERMLRSNPKLTTPFGFPRYFWDTDPNQAIAFWVASPAHCTIQDALIRLDERGALDKYGACNLMHDAIWWCCPEQLANECIAVAHEELEQPSKVLINSLGAFTCKADAKLGGDMESLMEV